ncbi:MAG TPA: hypothetical protein PKA00_06130 [Saprospiraceae bacterium]|nr:hypothetical protein [Saprospiraceae bacterium]HMQ82462.1 hypothetical protein [Saprospiraceae bacterium]
MTINTLISTINAAIQSNTLGLNKISGLSWKTDIQADILSYFKLNSLSITATGLQAVAAPDNSVNAPNGGSNLPSVLLVGTPDNDLLGIPKDNIQLTVIITPTDLTDTGKEVDFTIIAQIMPSGNSLTAWTPADSFPALDNSSVFNLLMATQPPSFLLTSFEHDQQWNIKGSGPAFSNTFRQLNPGLNLQLPSGLSTDSFPPLQALFGDLSLVTFYFNGQVDNTKLEADPNNLSIELLAELGSEHNLSLMGNGNFELAFAAGVQAVPSQTEANPPDTATQTLLKTQLVLQATMGKALIQAIVPLTGNTLSFSMSGLEGLPALSLTDIAFLFEKSFLSGHLPQSIASSDFFTYIGVQNIGLTIELPEGGTTPEISSILLEIGYSKPNSPYIGYQHWFDLQRFTVTWSVVNPFPVANSQPTVLLDGNFDLLGGDIGFEASFAKETPPASPSAGVSPAPASSWVFDIQGGLIDVPDPKDPDKNTNTIQLSKLFEQFSSNSADFPDIEIDALSFSAKPEEQEYAGAIDLEFQWSFNGYTAPKLNSIALDISYAKGGITGSISTQIAIGQAIFDFKAQRSETEWAFSANSEAAFSIGELAEAFGLDSYPGYLNEMEMKQASIAYTAPIAANSGEIKSPADSSVDSIFSVVLEVAFQIAGENLDATISYTVDKAGWKFDGLLLIGPESQPGQQLEFEFLAEGKKIAEGQNPTPSTETTLVATLKNPSGQDFSISSFAAVFGATVADLPEALNAIKLSSAQLEYDTGPNGKGFLFSAVSVEYGQLVFAVVKIGTAPAASWKPFFALAFTPILDFTHLPVVGSFISKFGKVDIEQIQIAATPEALQAKEVTELSNLLANANPAIPASLIPVLPDGTLPPEILLNAVLNLNGDRKHINLAITSGSDQNATPTPLKAGENRALAEEAPSLPTNNSQESVNKGFGPVQISKFNLGYTDGKIAIDVSGALTLAGIALSFQGMGLKVAFPPKSLDDVSFQLHGLGINVDKGSLRIAGGFITLDDHFDNFMGMLAVNAGPFGMQAYGGYATTTPQPSFFIFVNVNVPIGGPPFFFVDGLSGGFGFNRKFIMPGFDELATFPLLPAAANNPIPTGPPNSLDDISKTLTVLAKYIPPTEGAYWVAGGLGVTSFEIIQLNAILEVSFGGELQIGLLGNASMSIPEPVEPIAYIDINFEVNVLPAEGIFQAFGMLTPASFIYGGACHLSGGFAFFLWGKNPHEGDFVVTIGGYHPAFAKPSWYPAVPRLRMFWGIGPLNITGQAYFALTPHLLMAGMSMSAYFSAGPIKATFDAGFDFLLGWKPFFYLADAYIHINIEVHLLFTFHFHVGVDVKLWGPKFGGTARVDLDIISFTIPFGSSGPTVRPLEWDEFKKLLPNSYPQSSVPEVHAEAEFEMLGVAPLQDNASPFSVSQVVLSKGLLQQASKDPLASADFGNEKVFNWLVDPNHFQFQLSAGVPCNDFSFNHTIASQAGLTPASGTGNYVLPGDEAAEENAGKTIFEYDYSQLSADEYWWKIPITVGPMDLTDGTFKTQFIVKVYTVAQNGLGDLEDNFVVTMVTSNSAGALWGGMVNPNNGNSQLNAPATLPGTLTGLVLMPKKWHPLQTRNINIYLLLFQQNPVYWILKPAPAVAANTFAETLTDQGNTMSFNMPGSGQISSQYRQFNTDAFGQIATGKALIDQVNAAFGFDQEVSLDAAGLATPIYKDWPILALLGEEDEAAANQLN